MAHDKYVTKGSMCNARQLLLHTALQQTLLGRLAGCTNLSMAYAPAPTTGEAEMLAGCATRELLQWLDMDKVSSGVKVACANGMLWRSHTHHQQ